MLKINKNLSSLLSLAASFVLGAVLIVLTVAMPALLKAYIGFVEREYLLDSFGAIIALFYGVIVVAMAADAALIILLYHVRRGTVFTDASVACIRAISWACLAEGIIFAVLAAYFPFSALVSAAAVFIGLIVRVVKNVIEEATAIKNENDMTV